MDNCIYALDLLTSKSYLKSFKTGALLEPMECKIFNNFWNELKKIIHVNWSRIKKSSKNQSIKNKQKSTLTRSAGADSRWHFFNQKKAIFFSTLQAGISQLFCFFLSRTKKALKHYSFFSCWLFWSFYLLTYWNPWLIFKWLFLLIKWWLTAFLY